MIKSKVYCFLTDSIIMLTHGTQLVISTHVFYRKWRTSQGHMHCQAVKSTVSVVIYRKLSGSQIHCKCGNISKTVQDRDVVRPTTVIYHGLWNSGNSDDLEW